MALRIRSLSQSCRTERRRGEQQTLGHNLASLSASRFLCTNTVVFSVLLKCVCIVPGIFTHLPPTLPTYPSICLSYLSRKMLRSLLPLTFGQNIQISQKLYIIRGLAVLEEISECSDFLVRAGCSGCTQPFSVHGGFAKFLVLSSKHCQTLLPSQESLGGEGALGLSLRSLKLSTPFCFNGSRETNQGQFMSAISMIVQSI